MKTKPFICVVILASFALLYPWCASAQHVAHITGVSVQAEPTEHAGPCPKTFRFTGTITVDRAGKVKYRWMHSDNKHRPPAFTTFAGPDAHTVRDTWTIGNPTTPFEYKGYARLQILSPITSLSDKAAFSVKCIPRGSQKKPASVKAGR